MGVCVCECVLSHLLPLLFLLLLVLCGSVCASPTHCSPVGFFSPTVPSKRLIFDRERSSNSYSVSSFYWGLTLSDIPAQLIIPVLTTLMVYWTVGLQDQVCGRDPCDHFQLAVFFHRIVLCSTCTLTHTLLFSPALSFLICWCSLFPPLFLFPLAD